MGSRERVAGHLSRSGVDFEIREFDASTKSSALAARALGCTLGEIAKSVVFSGPGTAVVIVSGDRRVSPSALARLLGGEVRVATPGEVRERTGYPIGGVPPFPHGTGVRVFADVSLKRFPRVWAAAGAPNAVFRIGTEDLVRLVGRPVCDVSELA